MNIKWTAKALSDLARLHEFLAKANPQAAAKTVQLLAASPRQIAKHPRLGERLEEFEPREIRRLLVGSYELRYELCDATLYILRLWHTREER
ncbi:type II toxin-antitoxin system RelE/ParE family toxin [Pantoea sp.]|uniref:type II toxin-antitoxin system RelE/ParE family toxin n=1 Tax=Pantoea sp. TaxID=69393 RepID=UPI0028A285DB|nr:type II toxin-antitoxin system RelE/ParE family toxin [Pantoea sp.]